MISGVVIQVGGDAGAVARGLAGWPGVVAVELPPEPYKVVAVLEAEDEAAMRAAIDAIGKLERVLGIYPAYIDFGEGEST